MASTTPSSTTKLLTTIETDYGKVRLWIAGHPTWACLVSFVLGGAVMFLKLKL